MGAVVPGVEHADSAALRLLETVLGRGADSRLAQTLAARGLPAAVQTHYAAYAGVGVFAALAAGRPPPPNGWPRRWRPPSGTWPRDRHLAARCAPPVTDSRARCSRSCESDAGLATALGARTLFATAPDTTLFPELTIASARVHRAASDHLAHTGFGARSSDRQLDQPDLVRPRRHIEGKMGRLGPPGAPAARRAAHPTWEAPVDDRFTSRLRTAMSDPSQAPPARQESRPAVPVRTPLYARLPTPARRYAAVALALVLLALAGLWLDLGAPSSSGRYSAGLCCSGPTGRLHRPARSARRRGPSSDRARPPRYTARRPGQPPVGPQPRQCQPTAQERAIRPPSSRQCCRRPPAATIDCLPSVARRGCSPPRRRPPA